MTRIDPETIDRVIFVHYLELALAMYDNTAELNYDNIEPLLKHKAPWERDAILAFLGSLDNSPRFKP